MNIVRKSVYRGYPLIETRSPRGKPSDPFTIVPVFATQLRAAIEATA